MVYGHQGLSPAEIADFTTTERRVFVACVGGWALDAMNVQLYSFVIPALIAVWGLTRGQAGVLGTAALLVSAAGGWVAGWFADRYGRVLTLQIAILTFAVFTFLSGLAQNYAQLFVARALLVAVARHPMINSIWDEQAQEIIVRHYVNLGFAAATERGLIVPNIKDAQALTMPGLARALAGLTATARDGRCTPADLTGGTITITNVGVFGVDAGTPILTPGEAAILAFGRIRDAAWVHDGEIAVRQVTTLSLSFDHRIVDGELGSAVLRDVGQMLEDPIRMLAWT